MASPPPAPVAAYPPPAPPVVSFAGPMVFVLSPLRGNSYDVDRYYYSPSADVTQGDYAALLSFAAHYGYPIAIIHCPDIAAFQASYPSAIVRPFSEVPPPFLRRGYELMHSSITSTSLPRGDSGSLLSHDPSAPSAQVSLRGNDPPSVVAGIRASSTVMSPAGMGARPPPRASTARPDPDGLDAPLPFMGGMGGPRFFGRSSSSFGHPPHQPSLGSGFSTSSMADSYRQLNFPGPIPAVIPQVVFGRGHRPPPPPPYGGFPPASAPPVGHHHAPASVASPAAFAASPHRPLSHEDLSASSESDLTMSFPPPVGVPAAIPSAPPPVLPPVPVLGGGVSPPPVSSPAVVISPPAVSLRPSAENFKLPVLKDAKAYLDVYDMILYWLRQPEYGTQLSDESLLITTPSNVAASLFWEGQIRSAVREGSLRFLFDNKGTLYHGKGFEMLAVLNQHCRPDTVSGSFSTLMSLFNDVQGPSEPVLEFRSRFDGLVLDLSRSKIVIPPILLLMLFLRALHSRYSDILDQFRSRYKDLEKATLDSVVEDARYHDEFKLVGDKKTPGGRPTPTAATANVDKQGKEWPSPFEWLSTYATKGIKTRWERAIAGTGICPICHRAEKPWHVPANCPLLKDLNLKLVNGPPRSSPPAPAPSAAPAPTPAAPAPSPSPGGRVASANECSVSGSVGSPSAPSGLMASVADDDFDSDEDFRWAGDESGLDYSASVDSSDRKSNARVAPYPSCYHVSVLSTSSAPSLGELDCPSASISRRSSSSLACSDSPPSISPALHSLLTKLSHSSISPDSGLRLAVADSGATDHMFPDKSAFISYKSISHLKVRMGNNSYLPVLARGSAIISLNGQRVLVRNALHVPGLAMPLYSLRAHFQQPGCGFLGTNDVGMLVYFPSFVLSADTSSDCTLSYEPLGRSAPLSTLHYVQPRCRPSLYPSELSPSSNTVAKTPALIEDEPSVAALVPPDAPLVPTPLPPPVDLAAVASQLQSIAASVLPPLPPLSTSPPVPKPPVLLSTMTSDEISRLLHHPDTSFPDVRPCDTANASDTKTHWSSEELHRIMGCRKFRNYKHILDVSRDGEWIDGGEFPMSLGSFTTIPKAKRGAPLVRTSYRYLDAVHMDIAFGDCVSVGGYRYALILVDRATRYNWAFGLKSLSSDCILAALRLFRAAAGSFARCFYCDCDPKLFGRAISDYLVDNSSKVVAAPAKRQSSNGLVESHWKTMVHMARAYLTEKQMPRAFWFYAIVHSARMMNAIPGKIHGRIASPFLLVHGVGHDERTWIPLFSLCYFHHEKDGDIKRSKHQAHSMDGVIIGRSPTSNALLVYNPRNKQYYEPDSYRIDSYRLPGSVYRDLKYDGGLFCSLYRDDNPPIEELYPPGTRVERIDPTSHMLLAGTVMDIPFSDGCSADDSLASPPSYTVLFDNGTSASIPLRDMASIIPKPPIDIASSDSQDSLLPPFLRLNSKITYEHDGQYHKGYLGKVDGVYRFVFKSHANKRKEEWGVNLPNLPTTWVDLCVEGTLVPGHVSHSFLRPTNSPNQSTFDPVASFVSAVNLHRECPPTLLKALADSHPDREIWLESYREEKQGIESLDTYRKITLGEYRALREKGAPKAIPTMCVLTIKKDENLCPLRAKSRIVVLGNHEDRLWSKSDRFAPVLRQDSLRFLASLAVEKRRALRQGDCKNAFCQGILPPEEITIVRPPSGDPDADPHEYWLLRKTLYGLRRSPRHWYDKINAILISIGLTPSLEDPCLYSGFIRDPSDPTSEKSTSPLTLGLYVDDFVYFSEDPSVEALFCRLLAERCKVDFMGVVEWFLGIHFSWRITSDSVSVHLNQSGFAANLVESFFHDSRNETPTATPYRSGVPIDSIAPSTDEDDSPAQLRRTAAYQSLIGSIGWLSSSTRPDLSAVHSFLASYSNKPSVGHMKAALYALHYIHSTHDYGISFTSDSVAPMHCYIHFPPSTDVEAYTDALPPTPTTSSTLSSYSDACWGSQIGNAVADGTLLPLFKFRSMSGGIVFRNGGPVGWLGERQEQTSLSSCEAEIRATNATSKKVVDFRNLCQSMVDSGHNLSDVDSPTLLFNDNDACVRWSYNMTSKAARHIELRENSVREWIQSKLLTVKHVSGKINPSDIFTKEMRDGMHFRRLRDSFMSRLSDFVNASLLAIHHVRQSAPLPMIPAAAHAVLAAGPLSYFSALASSSFCRSLSAISHLSSAGRQLLRGLHGFVPSGFI